MNRYERPFDLSIDYLQVVPDEVKKILGWISLHNMLNHY
jgi:hypothetical protein